jgi:tRNA(Ser,Leu) C12 N-acetylase TAN1
MYERNNNSLLANDALLTILKKKESELRACQIQETSLSTSNNKIDEELSHSSSENFENLENHQSSGDAGNLQAQAFGGQEEVTLGLLNGFWDQSSFYLVNDSSAMNVESQKKAIRVKKTLLESQISILQSHLANFEERVYTELKHPENGYWPNSQPQVRDYVQIEKKVFNHICEMTLDTHIEKLVSELTNPFYSDQKPFRISTTKKKRPNDSWKHCEFRTLDELIGQTNVGKNLVYVDEDDWKGLIASSTILSKELQFWMIKTGIRPSKKKKLFGESGRRDDGEDGNDKFWIYEENFLQKQVELVKRGVRKIGGAKGSKSKKNEGVSSCQSSVFGGICLVQEPPQNSPQRKTGELTIALSNNTESV